MSDQTTFLNLHDLFINQITGSEWIFVSVSFIVILVILAKFRTPNNVAIVILAAYSLMLSAFFQSILGVTLVVIGFLIAWAISRLISRG